MPASPDPDKRKRQLANLAYGREVAKARREAGLPSKRSEERRGARVVDGGYQDPPAPTPAKPKPAQKPRPAAAPKPAPRKTTTRKRGTDGASTHGAGGDAGGGQEPPRWARIAGRIMGID